MNPVVVTRGDGPIVLGLPHCGTALPPEIAARLNPTGRALADTDWHVDRLYDGLLPDLTTVRATFHRYVIDANRDPSGDSLYPGQNTTGLVPLTNFDGHPIWKEPPDAAQVAARRAAFHAPYHAALLAELRRVKHRHGMVILYDCHSIRSRIPFLFDATLPDISIGTNNGMTCAAILEKAVVDICSGSDRYTSVLNGRFKGGWTTRHYGRPHENMHAIQIELAQSTYLAAEAPPWGWDDAKAMALRAQLRAFLQSLAALAPTLRAMP